MKKLLIVSLLSVSGMALAHVSSSSEPMVNFDGVQVGITETCLSNDGQSLQTKEAVSVYAHINRAGKPMTTYVGKKILETGLTYVAQGKCLQAGPKLGTCVRRAPRVEKTYPLSGSFEISHYRIVNGKAHVKTSSESVDFNVEYCQ